MLFIEKGSEQEVAEYFNVSIETQCTTILTCCFLNGHRADRSECCVYKTPPVHQKNSSPFVCFRMAYSEKVRIAYNAIHFPELKTFPDHKHLPNDLVKTEEPNVTAILLGIFHLNFKRS